jgi:hypothetical protein
MFSNHTDTGAGKLQPSASPFAAATLLLHAPAHPAQLALRCCTPLSVTHTQQPQRLCLRVALCRAAQSSPASVKTLCGVATTRASPRAPPEMGAYLQQQQQGRRGVPLLGKG